MRILLLLLLCVSAPLYAQESYDPFVDFSEYEEVAEEEADVNFFRNGRFVTIGAIAGYRGFTGNLTKVYEPDLYYGLQLSYFFDLRFALQFSFANGQNGVDFTSPADSSQTLTGNSQSLFIGVHLKYYLNTENVTKGLAELNPYIIGGFSFVNLSSSLSQSEVIGGDNANSFDIGFGMEIPIANNQMYIGFQGVYNIVNFSDEAKEIKLNTGGVAHNSGFMPSGDMFHVGLSFGTNF